MELEEGRVAEGRNLSEATKLQEVCDSVEVFALYLYISTPGFATVETS